jgi:putative ABC transport system ATP-binding protein
MRQRERVALRRSEFGFVFQQHFLINYLTVLENVMVAAPVQDKADAAQARALLADLGMGDKLHRFPYELSGGERQRVAVARAMIHRPRIIFADEPTGLLDRTTGLQVMALLRGYCGQGSLVAVTHNPELLSEADLVVTLRGGEVAGVKDRLTRVAEGNGPNRRVS